VAPILIPPVVRPCPLDARGPDPVLHPAPSQDEFHDPEEFSVRADRKVFTIKRVPLPAVVLACILVREFSMRRGITGRLGKFPALGKIQWAIDPRNFPKAPMFPINALAERIVVLK
jgi:hypothetical protein